MMVTISFVCIIEGGEEDSEKENGVVVTGTCTCIIHNDPSHRLSPIFNEFASCRYRSVFQKIVLIYTENES